MPESSRHNSTSFRSLDKGRVLRFKMRIPGGDVWDVSIRKGKGVKVHGVVFSDDELRKLFTLGPETARSVVIAAAGIDGEQFPTQHHSEQPPQPTKRHWRQREK